MINQENKGVSSARNNGFKFSKGEYVVFFDVDDKYDLDICQTLYDLAKNSNAEISCLENLGSLTKL